ncbi:MAG: HDIG domain-containing metalloprotein [Ignavibacteria bacterium]|jgi:putative nucleotidyltransferase with HDIG domain|nr:HDIG domain-containing protein [Ignavibacteria bacterium]
MTREEAVQLLFEYTKSDALRKHAFAVESCMIAYAEKFGEDVNEYSVTGILHDFDYEMYPNAPDHPLKGSEILRQKGVDEKIIKAILGHASYTNVERDTLLAKTLFACDELAGFITAVTYVRPNKTIDEVEVKSVTKKLKDKAFARNVSREDIYKGAEELGVPLEEHIAFCIEAMKKRKDLLGL